MTRANHQHQPQREPAQSSGSAMGGTAAEQIRAFAGSREAAFQRVWRTTHPDFRGKLADGTLSIMSYAKFGGGLVSAGGALMLRLFLQANQPDDLTRVLAIASLRLTTSPELATPLARRDGYNLTADLTDTYGEPSMVRGATRLRVAMNETGWIYSLDEQSAEGSMTGGWMGSCIPAGKLRRFFLAWLEQTDPYLAAQISLF